MGQPALPEGHAPYQRTRTFSRETVPPALLARHETNPGVWALIHVERGELEYTLHGEQPSREVLRPGRPGVAPPRVPHEVRPLGPVEFYVEFWRAE